MLKTALLGIIIIYLYSVLGFLYLNKLYNDSDDADANNYAYTLELAFTSTLNNGLRYGGGIGDSI